MPKDNSSKNKSLRHNPLEIELKESEGRLRRAGKKNGATDDDALEDEMVIDSKTSSKILKLAKQQDDEIKAEARAEIITQKKLASGQISSKKYEFDEEDTYAGALDSDEDEEEEQDYSDYEYEEIEINPEDEALYNKYVGGINEDSDEPQQTLADKIMEKIREKEMIMAGEQPEPEEEEEEEEEEEPHGVMLPEKVIAVYVKVGELLSRYKSGKLPRAFKIIPTLRNWEDVLYVTQPESWSPQAIYEATKIFISSLDSRQCQKYVYSVLLDRFRSELESGGETGVAASKKTLNYHTYRALKKSLYKPAAFFKGFLFPLAESGTCTVREATIAASILAKVSVPVLHSGAALMRLSEYEYYSAPTSLFMKVLLDKKYALPYKVIDSVVFHFMRFKNDKKKLPILWHQCFLVFAQRYKNDITEDQRDFLMDVLKVHNHPEITPEIRRELTSGTARVVDTNMEIDG
ncbi:uncharacterized protein SAPINGB_P004613 [Magnusiomyces paraingens]|uniref:Bystin n=1 Tax=Magnusiomyces paraingens TaxID=2606893 RepID=A0A5E8BWI0_9ASCO|nr:uncharacterized protein SAPINGB_P004613 [Saprochaete ingens]VVT55471.1 unnamed protein product [Saprochaete ingens]